MELSALRASMAPQDSKNQSKLLNYTLALMVKLLFVFGSMTPPPPLAIFPLQPCL
jgi:hypothetical protein